MNVYLLGNPLLPEDCLPIILKPSLIRHFPSLNFLEADPTENFTPENGSAIIDTVVGLKKVHLFNSIEVFVDSPRVSVHDYDLALHLKLLKKLGKVENIQIIGLPVGLSGQVALNEIYRLMKLIKASGL